MNFWIASLCVVQSRAVIILFPARLNLVAISAAGNQIIDVINKGTVYFDGYHVIDDVARVYSAVLTEMIVTIEHDLS
jgi:hypothetical protein